MSVVFRESTRKMTPKNKLSVLVVMIGWVEGIAGAAFSNVVVQRADVVPLEYINYDPNQFAFTNPQLAQLSAPPFESVVPVPASSAVVSPCLAPCVITNVPSSGVAPIPTPNAKIISYKPSVPNVPIVVTNQEVPRGYQYAYAVYDDHTGDKKSQSEHSDGSVVQGQYSFIQPDGFRREVIYTADDLKGFNAIVRNISPEPEQPKEEKVTKNQPAPCPDNHSEHLTHYHGDGDISKEVHVELPHLEEQKNEEKSQHDSEITVETTEKGTENLQEIEEEKPNEEISAAGKSIENSVPVSNSVISYSDILKCLQAKLQNTNNAVSPLTYVIIPSLKSPC